MRGAASFAFVVLALAMPTAVAWTNTRPGVSVAKVSSFRTRSSLKVATEDLETTTPKRATISLDKKFERGLESQWKELDSLNSSTKKSTPVTKKVNGVVTRNTKQDVKLSKITHSGKGLFVLGKDLVGSSVAFVKQEFRSRTLKIRPTTPAPNDSSSDHPTVSSLSRTHRIVPLEPEDKDATTPQYSATLPVNSQGTVITTTSHDDDDANNNSQEEEDAVRSVEDPRPTVSLSPPEASEQWGYAAPAKAPRPNGMDYMNDHLKTLRMNTVEWVEDARVYTASASADVVEGISSVYDNALDAVVHFQANAATDYERSYSLNPAFHIRAPQHCFYYATIQTYPIINSKICKVPCARPPMPTTTHFIDPSALYFVNFHHHHQQQQQR